MLRNNLLQKVEIDGVKFDFCGCEPVISDKELKQKPLSELIRFYKEANPNIIYLTTLEAGHYVYRTKNKVKINSDTHYFAEKGAEGTMSLERQLNSSVQNAFAFEKPCSIGKGPIVSEIYTKASLYKKAGFLSDGTINTAKSLGNYDLWEETLLVDKKEIIRVDTHIKWGVDDILSLGDFVLKIYHIKAWHGKAFMANISSRYNQFLNYNVEYRYGTDVKTYMKALIDGFNFLQKYLKEDEERDKRIEEMRKGVETNEDKKD